MINMIIRVFVAVIVCGLLCVPACAAEKKLNVLFVAVDDLRPELGCYGSAQAKTPHMDRLAKSGLRFDRAYCQLALCNPSRASLLAGKRPETMGVFDLKTFVRKNDPDVVTLPQLFKRNGYASLRFGKIFHTTNGNHDDPVSWSETTTASKSLAAGPVAKKPKAGKKKAKASPATDPHADELPYGAPDCADDDLTDGRIAKQAIEAMREHKDRPFFLAVGFHKPHLPFVAPKKYWDLYDADKIRLAPNPSPPDGAPEFASNDASELRRYMGVPKSGPMADAEAKRLIHGYYACTSYADAQVGRLLDELDRLGLRENTVVVLWGDHGYHLGEHGTWNKRTNWEIATRVPMMISAPGQKARGAATQALVELVDIYPTLAGLCGLPMPDALEGTSFAPLLDEPASPWKRAAFSVYQKEIPGAGVGLGRAMRTESYRFIEWADDKATTRILELYDHRTDPRETKNVAALPENRALVEDLTRQLREGWKGAGPPQPGS